jgi:hypothetical protein
MADKRRIYKTSDWSIWTESPSSLNNFVLDVSKLNGSDVLGSAENTIKNINAEIVSITISDGGDMEQGIFTPINPMSMIAVLNVKNFVYPEIKNYYIGKNIWAMLKNAQTYSDPVYGLNTPMFTGVISSFDVSVEPGEDFATIIVQAVSKTENYLNTQITINKSIGNSRSENLTSSVLDSPYDFGVISFDDYWTWGTVETETRTLGEWLQDFSAASTKTIFNSDDQLVVTGTGPGGNWNYEYLNAIRLLPLYEDAQSSYVDNQIIGMEYGWHNSPSPSSVSLSTFPDALDEIIEVKINPDPNLTINQTIYTSQHDVNGLSEITNIANELVSYSESFSIKSFRSIVAKDNEYLWWAEQNGGFSNKHFIRVRDINYTRNTIYIYSDNNKVEGLFVICGRTMEINSDNWTNTYQLWKWK